METQEDSKNARVTAVIEFRGKALTLALTDGDCNVGQLAWRLSKFHFSRYRKQGLRILSPPGTEKLCDCTLDNPDEFVNFLHLIQTNGGLTVKVSEQRSPEYGGVGQVESFRLGSKEYHFPQTRDVVPARRTKVASKQAHEIRVQLADRVYTPLLKEADQWKDPRSGSFYEWNRLQQEERLWVKKVPRPIVEVLAETGKLFKSKAKLWMVLKDMVDEAINVYGPEILGRSSIENVANFDFRLVAGPGNSKPLYIMWIWEAGKSLSNYVNDIMRTDYPPNTEWRLETWVTSLPTGTVKQVGNENQTRQLINKVLSYLAKQELARELLRMNRGIKDNASRLVNLIDAEL